MNEWERDTIQPGHHPSVASILNNGIWSAPPHRDRDRRAESRDAEEKIGIFLPPHRNLIVTMATALDTKLI